MKAQTSCKGCVFAVKQDESQVGCELYRSEKLGIVTEDGIIIRRFAILTDLKSGFLICL